MLKPIKSKKPGGNGGKTQHPRKNRIDELESKMDRMGKILFDFISEQRKFNEDQRKFNKTVLEFMTEQREFNNQVASRLDKLEENDKNIFGILNQNNIK